MTKVALKIQVDPDMKRWLDAEADSNRLSTARLIRRLLAAYQYGDVTMPGGCRVPPVSENRPQLEARIADLEDRVAKLESTPTLEKVTPVQEKLPPVLEMDDAPFTLEETGVILEETDPALEDDTPTFGYEDEVARGEAIAKAIEAELLKPEKDRNLGMLYACPPTVYGDINDPKYLEECRKNSKKAGEGSLPWLNKMSLDASEWFLRFPWDIEKDLGVYLTGAIAVDCYDRIWKSGTKDGATCYSYMGTC